MKNIFKSILSCCAFALCTMPLTGCSDDDTKQSTGKDGIWDITNPVEDSEVSSYGETITVSFLASGEWDAVLETSDKASWVNVLNKKYNAETGKSSIQLKFDDNESDNTRSVDIHVTVTGHSSALLCTLTQGSAMGAKIDQYLNNEMHKRLASEYLWNKEYNALYDKGDISFKTSYDKFLYTNLTKLGDVNIEDGGKYREYSNASGQRYIYSYIQEIGGVNASAASSPATRASQKAGLGFGPSYASWYDETTPCLAIAYIYQNSAAAEAGMRRGDLIISVNGTRLNASNYSMYQQELYLTTSGTYDLRYARFKEDGSTLVEYTAKITAKTFDYNPVLVAAQLANTDQSINIGYLVLESFDISGQEAVEYQLKDFADKGIKDLIIDLRFNPGGSVAQCRYLMSSIVGPANYDKTFAKMTFNDNSQEVWSFGYGDPTQPDGLGQGPDLGLKRLYVICSENTGSAAEIVINSLKGIDFEVHTYGSRTEGKNVGMVTSQLTYNGRRFEYAPITFWVKNAKDFGDYADGFEVDHVLNNQNASDKDDIDKMFPYGVADWGNLKGDAALIWAVENATTGKDPDFNISAAAAKFRAPASRNQQILDNMPIKPAMGRFGNIIYGKTEAGE